MTYDEIRPGQRVLIKTATERFREEGEVYEKRIVEIAGEPIERVWVHADSGKVRICRPEVLVGLE